MLMDPIQHQFASRLADLQVELYDSDKQLDQFERYFRLLVEWNEKMNLTGIIARDAVYEKHFYDSLTLCLAVDLSEMNLLVDVGSGAGFPAIPLKIAFPHLQITIIDALAKRIRFLQEVVSQLGLEGVTCLHGRAEDFGRKPEHRDRYDIATARAVARLASLNELCLPFVKPGGSFIAMKGSQVDEELEESKRSVNLLRAEIARTLPCRLPGEGASRNLIVIRKLDHTPKAYPRKPGIPIKQPLVGK